MSHGGPDDDPDEPDEPGAVSRWSWPAAALGILIASLLGWITIIAVIRWLWR